MPSPAFRRTQSGFTLIEILVALAILTIISVVLLSSLAPWMDFKHELDTQDKLNDIQQGLVAYYEANAFAIDSNPGSVLGGFTTNAPAGGPNAYCSTELPAFSTASSYFSNSAQYLSVDGYKQNWCVFVSPPLSATVDGIILWYHNIAFVSAGKNGHLDAGTSMDSSGVLHTSGDDVGVLISGYPIEQAKMTATLSRMHEINQAYSTYFTSRYLAYADRDVTRDYFSSKWDTSSAGASLVGDTAGNWADASTLLQSPLGLGPSDTVSDWEANNSIQVGNDTESQGSVQVRSPDTTGSGSLPYTALLRAQVPSPTGTSEYLLSTVIGNY